MARTQGWSWTTSFLGGTLLVLTLVAASCGGAQSTANLPAQMQAMTTHINSAMDAAKANDVAKARAEFQAYDTGWNAAEDAIKAKSPDTYKQVEAAMDEVDAALVKTDKPDPAKVSSSLQQLSQRLATATTTLR